MIEPLTYFLLLLKGSLLSSGGLGNLPIVHQDFVARRWASETQFAGALAIGQMAPGPGGLWVVALGYLIYGIQGAALASGAILLPPLLVLIVDRVHGRYAQVASVRGFIQGTTLAAVASAPVVYMRVSTSSGSAGFSIIATLTSLVLIASRRVPIPAVLIAGGVAGILFYR